LSSEPSQIIFFEVPVFALPPSLSELFKTLLELAGPLSKLALPVAVVTSGFSLIDLMAALLALFLALLGLLGLRRNRRTWGVVYNALTKQPLERAIVRLFDAGTNRQIEVDVTGSDGVFSFQSRHGRYTLKVNRSGFVFPSRLVRGSGSDGEYERLYHGENLEVNTNDVAAVSIPMDPAEARNALLFRFQELGRRFGAQLNWGVLIIGIGFSILTLRLPSFMNILIFIAYLALLIRSMVIWKRKQVDSGLVLERTTSQPIEGVGVSLYDAQFGNLVQRRVSDVSGRFQFRVPPGRYRLDVVTQDWSLDVSGPKGFRGEILTVPAGRRTAPLAPRVYVVRRDRLREQG
jgi:hypothetical protein